MSKRIGILGWKIGANSFGITLPYFRYIASFGSVVVIEPNNPIDTKLDLLVLPGGPDLNTSLYDSGKFDIDTQKPCTIRTHFMKNSLQKYIEANVPIFGICLGHQMLAAHVGNELVQDMYHETNEESRSELVHRLDVNGDYMNKFNLKTEIRVNSLHHQVVSKVKLKNVELVAVHSPKNRKNNFYPDVEALKYNQFRGYSVQWHPEEIYDPLSKAMINDLLNKE